jgi:anaerobic magnesium-protoporphyrin IX monomethyl ester cyclase
MRITLCNVPHPAIGSRIPDDHLPPLGLLAIGGPLLDAGHDVVLVDGDRTNRPLDALTRDVLAHRPDIVLLGHSGSTSAHPRIAEVSRRLRALAPDVRIVVGGVFPTYHWKATTHGDTRPGAGTGMRRRLFSCSSSTAQGSVSAVRLTS